jgi:hypothetical protein
MSKDHYSYWLSLSPFVSLNMTLNGAQCSTGIVQLTICADVSEYVYEFVKTVINNGRGFR